MKKKMKSARFPLFFQLVVITAAFLVITSTMTAGETSGTVSLTIEPGPYSIGTRDGHHTIHLDEYGLVGDMGGPRLPGKIIAIAIPPGATPTNIRFESDEPEIIQGQYDIAPAPLTRPLGNPVDRIQRQRQTAWNARRDEIYGTDALYPVGPAEFVRRAGFHQYNLVDVRVTPIRYRPLSGRLYIHSRITVHIEYLMPDERRIPAKSPFSDPQVEQSARELIANYKETQSWYPGMTSRRPLHDFVIITPDSLVPEVSPLVSHETAKGMSPRVVTVEWIYKNYDGADDAARIRNFLRDKYLISEWGIRHVLLVGGHSEVPMRECWIDAGYGRPYSDFYYAELSRSDRESWDRDKDLRYGEDDDDQVDLYSELSIGRIPWGHPATIRQICEKSAAFELDTDPGFKKNILVLGSYFWADTDTAHLMEAILDLPWMSEWTATRMYERNADYFSPFPCDAPLNNSNAVSTWSSETYCFVNWAGHGSPVSAHILGVGNPAFINSSDCTQLNNLHPSIVWADSCSNNDPHYANIGRAMLARGAVGFVGSTEVADGQPGWRDPSDGSSQSCNYWFSARLTSELMPQGEAHQWSMRKLYTDGLWSWPTYEMFEWTLWGNPNLGLRTGSLHKAVHTP